MNPHVPGSRNKQRLWSGCDVNWVETSRVWGVSSVAWKLCVSPCKCRLEASARATGALKALVSLRLTVAFNGHVQDCWQLCGSPGSCMSLQGRVQHAATEQVCKPFRKLVHLPRHDASCCLLACQGHCGTCQSYTHTHTGSLMTIAEGGGLGEWGDGGGGGYDARGRGLCPKRTLICCRPRRSVCR